MLFYNLEKSDSIGDVERYYEEFLKNVSLEMKNRCLKILVGCKADLKLKNEKAVQIEKFAQNKGFKHYITSAKLNKTVDEVF